MAISSNSKRIQITLNEDKEKEKVVLDYLASSFNEVQEIKRILFEYVVNQSGANKVKETKSRKKVIKDADSKAKLPKNTKSKSKVIESNESEQKLLTSSNSGDKLIKDNESKLQVIESSNNDDFTLNLSNFDDEVVEVNKSNNDNDIIEQNEMNELSKFM